MSQDNDKAPDQRSAKIRELNDAFRCHCIGTGTVLITQGINTIEGVTIDDVAARVQAFDDFSEENDPHGEHDFGAFEIGGEKVFWKIDYYDFSHTQHSPNAADPDVTHRVLTIMLASEY